MSSRVKRALCLLLAATLLLSLGAFGAEAKTSEYPSVRVYSDGLLVGRAYRSGQQIYLSVGDVCAMLGLEAEEQLDKTIYGYDVSIHGEGLELSAHVGDSYVIVNHRYLLNLRGVLLSLGRAYFPVALIERIFDVRATVSGALDRVDLVLREGEPLQGWETYYEDTFGEENVVWLARLINAEAANQPFIGMVGVGAVVMNRVRDERFPDNITDVIFDTKNGVQFQPVYDERIYKRAGPTALIAAYIALEGYTTVGDSLYFIQPERADDTWLREYYTFVVSIGDHDFYL